MARIRSIHPGLFTDEAYMSASLHARLLLPGIWCEAWDDGVIERRPLRLKARIFPADSVDVDELLRELEDLDMLRPFEVEGRKYAAIRNFRKWQNPKTPNSSGVLPVDLREYVGLSPAEPAPPDRSEIPTQFRNASARPENDFRNGSEKSGQKGGREEGRNVEDNPPSIPPAVDGGTPAAPVRERSSISDPEGFAEWWEAYPAEARTAPDYARKAYAKALQLGATPAAILAALRRDIAQPGKRPPMAPAAWLKGGSWRMDEAAAEPPRGNVTPIDRRFDGWEIADHMELEKWRKARSAAWFTSSESHNALGEDERRQALWDHLTGYRPRVARFLAQHEPDGIPQELSA